MSLLHLIPSCVTCNGFLQKNDREVKVSPYDSNFPFDKIRFELKILKPDFYYNQDSFGITFDLSRLNATQKADFETNMDIFSLDLHYKIHKSYILRIIQRNITYSEAYLKELKNNFSHLFKNENDMKDFINENIDTNFHLRPLSKLTHDITQEVGLLP